jgi:hypothetical protein
MLRNVITILIVYSSVSAFAQVVNAQSIGNLQTADTNLHIITRTGIGYISIGMKLLDVRNNFPKFRFERTTDGDGAALIAVKNGQEDLMVLYADEDDSDSPINWSKNIVSIETFDSLCYTKEGIHPGSLIVNVEKKYGKLKEIVMSEIETRQFASFETQPSCLLFRIAYCGEFKEGSNRTTAYGKDCKIISISIYNSK